MYDLSSFLLRHRTTPPLITNELQRENRELKDMLTHTHHRWWTTEIDKMKEADELIQTSNQPDYLQY